MNDSNEHIVVEESLQNLCPGTIYPYSLSGLVCLYTGYHTSFKYHANFAGAASLAPFKNGSVSLQAIKACYDILLHKIASCQKNNYSILFDHDTICGRILL